LERSAVKSANAEVEQGVERDKLCWTVRDPDLCPMEEQLILREQKDARQFTTNRARIKRERKLPWNNRTLEGSPQEAYSSKGIQPDKAFNPMIHPNDGSHGKANLNETLNENLNENLNEKLNENLNENLIEKLNETLNENLNENLIEKLNETFNNIFMSCLSRVLLAIIRT
jgi:hypothetical protein